MKKLTKKERNNIYTKVYKIANSEEWWADSFICNNIERESKVAKPYIFDVFQEFKLFAPLNYKFQTYGDPFCLDVYNPEIKKGGIYDKKYFTSIQQTILAFCIAMSE